ncbi:MAG: ribbon-helix-helix domain-containing protein [Longimicrobiales bacterium]
MRTTLDLDDAVLRAVKARAAEAGRTMTSFIEEALRDHLARISGDRAAQPLRWVVVSGGPRSGVDLADRDSILDSMEERR